MAFFVFCFMVLNELTGEASEAFVGDGSLAQVEHLQFMEVFAYQLQTRVAKLKKYAQFETTVNTRQLRTDVRLIGDDAST